MINFKENEELNTLNHSCAHVMAQAVKHLYPQAKFWVGPVVEEGFYYDMDLGNDVIRDEDLPKIEKEMKKCCKADKLIVRHEITREEALEQFKDDPYKIDLIKRMPQGTNISMYTQGDYTDLCRGPHVKSTKQCRYFKLIKHSGAYWKGDKNNKVLQRIYGVCFPTQEELDDYLAQLEDAKQRDHRKLGKELQMFMFSETVGAGMPMWLPNGFTVRRTLSDYIMDKELAQGYIHVKTPSVASTKLYKISGHLAHYKDDMFPIMSRDGDEYVLRPMNCPEHMIIYKSTLHSYRELPVRIAEIADDFRYEASGALTGIERARSFTQNDSHIFCRPDQIADEIKNITHLILDVYKDFGFDDYSFRLSLRDVNNKDKYFGNDELWEKSEAQLREVLKEMGVKYYEAIGEAAFYGPKIDVQVHSAIGHEVTLSTIQLDYQLPERFELEYVDKDGSRKRPVVIHRAILGSLDRFIAFLLEETKGNLPLWLAPRQVVVIPVSPEAHGDYAAEIVKTLRSHGIHAELDDRNEKLGYRIREAQTSRIPVEVVVGDGEIKDHGVTVRRYGSKEEVKKSLDQFIADLDEEIKTKKH
ncbi:MAG: threonine--tRNA ligase [Erysipelotrichaceae bacterium]|uniref:Threonine--tRNA ligase n=1 Tax=Grylomicrobium aquisgranensis TaxID=2926318 RepID=A0AB35U3L5_9FIRM|nr:threonine--tRNA ligase [Lactimicrobium massiliense]MCH4020098.1 threonine--tRNA ligase [Erysipelotrichaceae bacterium]MCI1325820.1 threonine--tRNA ligase [Solobacterium sp.]MDX8419269.1 threonine--tRNA ligase [Stecheria sp. CLA-KB-P133]MCH4044907.1 threonine--tRNA ligase [Erysipelotrichaceae bacterium]MCH4122119.1 threonine--tRNA ligase [Erysipelotrichaceae bacterium]